MSGAGMWPGPGGRLARVLGTAILLGLVASAQGFAVIGYVPEYRFDGLDWGRAFESTTHVVLFSIEPTADGGLAGVERLEGLLGPSSPFRLAVKAAGGNRPKILVSVGGAGRSQHFAAAAASKDARRTLAKRLAKMLVDIPLFDGIDLDWETPSSEAQWRDMGKLAKDIRLAYAHATEGAGGKREMLLTFTYHPGTGSVQAIRGIKGKKSQKGFLDFFDFGHAMAYSQFDRERRHSTHQHDVATIDEWTNNGLPAGKLTLGMPFFGVNRKSGETKTYFEILEKEKSLYERPDVDDSSDGVYFVNRKSAAQKVALAKQRGVGGIMIWELGQDAKTPRQSMLAAVWDAARGIKRDGPQGMLQDLHAVVAPYEDKVFAALAVLLGSYYMLQVLTGRPPPAYTPPERPSKKETAAPEVHSSASQGSADDAGEDEGEKGEE